MRCILVSCLLVLSLSLVQAEHKLEDEKSEITKLDVIELGESEDTNKEQHSESQTKRDSGYSYNRPDRFPLGNRNRFHGRPQGFKGKVVTRHPTQVSRPFNTYGPPNQQNSPATKPNHHGQQHGQQHGPQHGQQHGQQHKFHHFGNDHNNGGFNQEVPSPIRHYDFVEISPIASQNNEPFGLNTANYLPPRNQKLPAYSAPIPVQQGPGFQDQGQGLSDLRSQNLIHAPVNQISDAAAFLAENAQAIEQLYGSPASNQDFGPHDTEFQDQNNQIQNPNVQTLESSSQVFQPPIPAYASGTLDNRETLERIQSLEKDRLIQQLQRALVTQSQTQNVELLGRYAQNHGGLTQDQNILSSAQFPSKFHPITTPQSPAAFDQSFFLPGNTFSFSYRPTTTTQAPTTTTTISAPGLSLRPGENSKPDGTVQGVTSSPLPSQPGPSVPSVSGIPLYGGFVPTFITGTNFLNLPAYGGGVLTSGGVGPSVQTSGSTPTHFGIPIPTDPGKKPSHDTPSTPSTIVPAANPSAPQPTHPIHVPVQPFHPVVPLQPSASPVHPVTPVQPSVSPVTPLQPGGSPVHPVTPLRPAHPTYGVQPSVVNPLLYKPIKAVYPVYYYQNVAYQLQKPGIPSYPWSYAPAFAQAKPAQIWK